MRVLAPALALALMLLPPASAAPEQVRLGITEDPSTALTIHWLDLDPLASDTQTVTVDGEEIAARLVDGPSVGKAFEASVEGLAPDSEYEYVVGDEAFTFRTPPAALSAQRPIRIVALGDHGTNERSAATVAAIEELAPDLVLHMGDISYAEGRQNEWIDWFRMVEPVAANRPWVTALGNHETYTGASPLALVAPPSPLEIAFYQQRFGLPGNELWYSFDWAGIHVVALDTFSQQGIAQEEIAWLEEDLAANADAPWTIVFLHEPPFSSNAAHGSSERVQDAFVDIFAAHGVDLVLAAHDHSYERTVAMDGVVYLVSGGAGESLYAEWQEPAPDWSAARGAEYHVTLLEVYADRIEGRVVATQDGDLADTFSLASATTSGAPAAIVANETPIAWWMPLAALAIVAGRRRERGPQDASSVFGLRARR